MNGSKDDPVVKLDPNNPYLDFRYYEYVHVVSDIFVNRDIVL